MNKKDVFVDEYGVVYSADKKTLLDASQLEEEEYTVLDGVEVIGEWAFALSLKSRVEDFFAAAKNNARSAKTILASLSDEKWENHNDNRETPVSISNPTVKKNFTLKKVSLPESLKSIEGYAFCCCRALVSIELPQALNIIGDGAFSYCDSLASISIPERVIYLGSSAFKCCTSLTELEILSPYLLKIGDYAFHNCNSLKSINFSEKISYIGEHSFLGCTSLVNVQLPKELSTINKGAFNGCTALSTITLPIHVYTLEQGAFYGCTSLANVDIQWNGERPMVIAEDTFAGCENLKSINLPDMCNIKERAFKDCRSLQSINVPYGFDELKDMWKCFDKEFITEVTLSDRYTVIDESAFSRCSNLKRVVMGSKVKAIEENAFKNCKLLEDINIADDIESVEERAFNGCDALWDKLTSGIELRRIEREVRATDSKDWQGYTRICDEMMKMNPLCIQLCRPIMKSLERNFYLQDYERGDEEDAFVIELELCFGRTMDEKKDCANLARLFCALQNEIWDLKRVPANDDSVPAYKGLLVDDENTLVISEDKVKLLCQILSGQYSDDFNEKCAAKEIHLKRSYIDKKEVNNLYFYLTGQILEGYPQKELWWKQQREEKPYCCLVYLLRCIHNGRVPTGLYDRIEANFVFGNSKKKPAKAATMKTTPNSRLMEYLHADQTFLDFVLEYLGVANNAENGENDAVGD